MQELTAIADQQLFALGLRMNDEHGRTPKTRCLPESVLSWERCLLIHNCYRELTLGIRNSDMWPGTIYYSPATHLEKPARTFI